MFDRFADDARKAMDLARQAARDRHHAWIGTEHILLGLVALADSKAAGVLAVLGADEARIDAEVEAVLPRGADLPRNPGRYRLLTGDRPMGALHVGHWFGSLRSRVGIQALGVETFVVIADYQVLTDRDSVEAVVRSQSRGISADMSPEAMRRIEIVSESPAGVR